MKGLNLLPTVLLLGISFAYAQKISTVQPNSLHAPANVKVDGIATEWEESMQTYNKSIELYYTIANDNENLYLIVQAVNPRVIQKLLMTGLTLSVNSSGKKNDINNASVTFPLLNYGNSRHILIDAGLIPVKIRDNPADAVPADSLIGFINKNLTANAKEIKISNLSAITDTITGVMTDKISYFRKFSGFDDPGQYIGIENKDGIKAGIRLNDKKFLTYELAVPLKYFDLIKANGKKFAYNIRLNGLLDKNGDPPVGGSVEERRDALGVIRDPNQDLDFPTDFWGEYTLAGK